jgi:hypothetical protein
MSYRLGTKRRIDELEAAIEQIEATSSPDDFWTWLAEQVPGVESCIGQGDFLALALATACRAADKTGDETVLWRAAELATIDHARAWVSGLNPPLPHWVEADDADLTPADHAALDALLKLAGLTPKSEPPPYVYEASEPMRPTHAKKHGRWIKC